MKSTIFLASTHYSAQVRWSNVYRDPDGGVRYGHPSTTRLMPMGNLLYRIRIIPRAADALAGVLPTTFG